MRNRNLRFGIGRYLAAIALLPLLFVTSPQPAFANVIYVTTVDGSKLSGLAEGDADCSLAEAIWASRLQSSTAIRSYLTFQLAPLVPVMVNTACAPGSGDDTIVLPNNATIEFSKIIDDADNFVGPTATPMISSTITIEANGATLQWVGTSHARAFTVAGGGSLTLRNATIKGFSAKGGNGTEGGGGGLGAGGAIFVAEGGTSVIEQSTLVNNSATGGNGSHDDSVVAGGGGGGLGGNGGGPNQMVQGGILVTTGGGGGGSRGNGGTQTGRGGGTLTSGDSVLFTHGLSCGGDVGGDEGFCPGGGGGAGITDTILSLGGGGNGNYGGGGGGGSDDGGDGGNGGFGAGGGGTEPFGTLSLAFGFSPQGGNGGFGGGGGNGFTNIFHGGPGSPGPFGGAATEKSGGAGGAVGGAIANIGGKVVLRNSTLTGNSVKGGNPGTDGDGGFGLDGGGAIFSLEGQLTIQNSTISKNNSSSFGAGVEVEQRSASTPTGFTIENTIIYGNTTLDINGNTVPSTNECWVDAFVVAGGGSGNLIENDRECPGVVTTGDPLLGPLKNNLGFTPTMAIGSASAAFNAADPATSLTIDQRLTPRPEEGGFDIGAFEFCNPIRDPSCDASVFEQAEILTMIVSPPQGGTTAPAAGANPEAEGSVALVTASPNPGYVFQGWLGNVTAPASATTTVVMNQAQTVTAKFVPCVCAADVSGSVSVTPGGFVLNLGTKRYAQTVTLTNTSATPISGPISLVLDGLGGDVSLFNATGSTDALFPPAGDPYVSISSGLAPGQSISIALQFTDPTRATIGYTTRVLAGPGSR